MTSIFVLFMSANLKIENNAKENEPTRANPKSLYLIFIRSALSASS